MVKGIGYLDYCKDRLDEGHRTQKIQRWHWL